MPKILNSQAQRSIKVSDCRSAKITTSYRGFRSIDQEIEREIAMQWFTSSHKSTLSQRNFLLKKESF